MKYLNLVVRQTDKQKNGKLTNGQIEEKPARQTNRQTNKQTNKVLLIYFFRVYNVIKSKAMTKLN